MYIPPYYRNDDHDALVNFMRAHPFGMLISNGESVPFVTHLPFVVEEQEGRLTIISHCSRANPHGQALRDGTPTLTVFSGPHAYVSPSHYEQLQNVPTWNYVAVHARGPVRMLDDNAAREVLLKMIEAYEPAYRQQYDGLTDQYRDAMLKGIIAFAIDVEQLEGKFKLSQNKTSNERTRITEALAGSDDGAAREMADYMKKNNPSA